MNISAINPYNNLTRTGLTQDSSASKSGTATFDSIFEAAKNLINETNSYSNAAEEAESAYALGLTDSTHDLQVAQQKANLSLQYTVAIRNNVMDAYKEIMNLQF